MDLSNKDAQIPKIYPGLNMFQRENAMRFFSAESIIKAELGIDGVLPVCLEDYFHKIFDQHMMVLSERIGSTTVCCDQLLSFSSKENVRPTSHQSVPSTCTPDQVKLSSLFHLLSVLPASGVSQCKRVLDEDGLSWSVTFQDVLLVFLNWGASLQILGLEDMEGALKNMLDHMVMSQDPTASEGVFPEPHNVRTVLQVIEQRPPQSEFCQLLVLRLLVYATVDSNKTFRKHLSSFRQAITAVLDSFPHWDHTKAMEVAEFLELKRLGHHNAAYTCSTLFNQGRDRLSHVGLCASHNVLHHMFSFALSSECSFSAVVDQLDPPPQLFDRFQLWQLYVLMQLLESLTFRSLLTSSVYDKTVAGKLQWWMKEVHDHLKTHHMFTLSVDSGLVRERVSRLLALIVSKARSYHNVVLAQSSALCDDSPQSSPFKLN